MSFYPAKIKASDKWFSLFIRFRDNFTCVTCGKYCPRRKLNNPDLPMVNVQCSHVFSRRHQSIRHDERNAWTQCVHCHELAEENKKDYELWLLRRIGENEYNRLLVKKVTPLPSYMKQSDAIMAKYYRDKVKIIAAEQGKSWILDTL